MSQAKKVALLLGVFFLGCAAERLIVPPARAGTNPQRWEYFCKTEFGEKDVARMANELGQQGWEMTAVGVLPMGTNEDWCFRRPLP
jgi:hypothetical protein